VKLFPAQRMLLAATERLVAFVAGYGSGKTFSALLKLAQLAGRNPGVEGAYVAPTYPMAEDLGFRAFLALCDAQGIKHRENKAKLKVWVWMGAEPEWTLIHFLSGDKPDSLKGLNLGWALVDEAGMCDVAVWLQLLARVRVPCPLSQLIVIGTPEGGPGSWFGQVAEFGPTGEKADRLIRARTADNTTLPPEYLENMRSRYTEEEFRGYCEGYFVAAGGQIYRFNREKHVRPWQAADRTGEIQVWADFNVQKVVWLLAHVHNGVAHVFDEVVSTNKYTDEQALATKERLFAWGIDPRGLSMFHDSNTSKKSASARRDEVSSSDVIEIQKAGFRSKAQRQNPPVRDRISSVNAKLKAETLFVDPRCKELIASLSTQGRDKNGQPDKSGGLDHAADALGYGVHYQWPTRHKVDPDATRNYLNG
jgi:hypothetical protein